MKNQLAILQNKQIVFKNFIKDLERKYNLSCEETGLGDRNYYYNNVLMFTIYDDGETGEIEERIEPFPTRQGRV
jgi:uncharacterized protein YlxP (DUF503 family)